MAKDISGLKKKVVNEKVVHIPKGYGIFGIKREGRYIFFGWGTDMQKRCGNLLSKRKGLYSDCEFVVVKIFLKGLVKEAANENVWDLMEEHKTGWPWGYNKRDPRDGKWIRRGFKEYKGD